MACTTILVGKNASYDGSTIIARNEDCPNGEFTAKRFCTNSGEGKTSYTSVLGGLTIELPQGGCGYTCMPNADLKEGLWESAGVNERNVAMSATETLTTNERVLAADPLVERGREHGVPGGIGEEDMVTLVLPYIASAREGVERLGALLAEHGTYEMNGIAFADVDEVWWLETVGGHHWIARRVPDDCYAVIPNQLGLDSFDLDDALGEGSDHLCSADLREWMKRYHLDLTMGAAGACSAGAADETAGRATFNPREAFGSRSDADHVYNTPRAWDAQRFLNPSAGPWEEAGRREDFGPECDRLPWCRVPERKITVEDVKYVLSLHYQGTVYDPYGPLGTSATRGLYRPIGINRNCQLAVLQIRPYEPEERRALHWVSLGSNPFNALVPFFARVADTPSYLRNCPATPTTENFYWANRFIAAMADASFAACAPHVERYQQKLAAACGRIIARCDEEGGGLEEANAAVADECRRQTDDLLAKVLHERSLAMKNGFSRSDN